MWIFETRAQKELEVQIALGTAEKYICGIRDGTGECIEAFFGALVSPKCFACKGKGYFYKCPDINES